MRDLQSIVILTGAGISAESGLATFRDADGLWEGHRVEDVATPEAFRRDPALVQDFYDARRLRLKEVEPNAAHLALARLDAEWPGELLIVTQNVDDLHARAGARPAQWALEQKAFSLQQLAARFPWMTSDESEALVALMVRADLVYSYKPEI